MKSAVVSTIARKQRISDHSPIVVIELTNGQTIIREEFQFSIDCSNSNLLEEEVIRDCANGGTITGEFNYNEAGSSYVIDETSSLIKNGVINEATGAVYKAGDVAVRKSSGIRVEKFLTFAKNEDADLMDRVAAKMAAQMLQKRANRTFAPRAASTEEVETQKGEEETTSTSIPAGEEVPTPSTEVPATEVSETAAE